MKTTHAVWERENLGVDAYEIALDASDTPDLLRQEEARIIAAGAEYIVVKTPVDCPALLFSMQALGYTFVETVFHVMIRRDEYHMPASIARFDRGLRVVERREEADRERIYALIRRGVFKSDRVSIDPAFGRAKGGQPLRQLAAKHAGARRLSLRGALGRQAHRLFRHLPQG